MAIINPNTANTANTTTKAIETHEHVFPSAKTKLEQENQSITELINLSKLDKSTPQLTREMAAKALYLEEETVFHRITPVCPKCLYPLIELHLLSVFFDASPAKSYRAWGLAPTEDPTSDERWVIAITRTAATDVQVVVTK